MAGSRKWEKLMVNSEWGTFAFGADVADVAFSFAPRKY
jgi:hypothetical protein